MSFNFRLNRPELRHALDSPCRYLRRTVSMKLEELTFEMRPAAGERRSTTRTTCFVKFAVCSVAVTLNKAAPPSEMPLETFRASAVFKAVNNDWRA